MENSITIYAAGNPGAYPLEYYNSDTDSYQGIMPSLFEEFSKNSSYQITYYQPADSDSRQELSKNLQVDMISGYQDGDEIPEGIKQTEVFTAIVDGKEVRFLIGFTDTAPESFVADFTEYLEQIAPEKISGLLIEEASLNPQSQNSLTYLPYGLSLTLAMLCTILLVLLRKYRTRLKQAQHDIESDDVTGLGNQEYLQRYYRQFISDENRVLYSLIYFYIDTDKLRRLSGSKETEEMLRHCAVILKEYTADSDILAKISENSFVLMKLSADQEELVRWLKPVFHRIHDYTRQYRTSFELNISAGIYMLQADDRNLEEMIFNASQGAHLAEKLHKNYIFCSSKVMQELEKEKQIQSDIDRAFSNHEFHLYVQFYVDSANREIVGGEALSRWQHPQRGILLPKDFVPIMEREKTIARLDYYALKEACEFLQCLYEQQISNFFMSCNFSRETFAAADFVNQCKEIIKRYTFPKDLLIFEITESVTSKKFTQIRQNIASLKELGVSIALDDFGQGFTSFYDLQEYSFDGIKLDKGLIDNVLTKKGESILKAVIQVGHELGMTILAEGVESEAQAAQLYKLNCDVIQGFKFYYPLPVQEAERLILSSFSA